jgi:hypothetical protein
MPITKSAENFVALQQISDLIKTSSDYYTHATSPDNLHKILSSGQLMSLKKLMVVNPETEVSVEPNRWNRIRTSLAAGEALKIMDGRKHTDKVFLSRGGYVPSYGEHVILKQLKSPKQHLDFNLVPEEYVTRRSLSLKHNAHVYVPDQEVFAWREKYPKTKIAPLSSIPVNRHSSSTGAKTLLNKIRLRTHSFLGIDKAAAEFNVTHSGVKRHLSRNAMLVGSSELGTNIDDSDIDVFIPFKNQHHFDKAKSRLLPRLEGFKESPANLRRNDKFTVSGKMNGQDVDVVLAHGERALNFQKAFLDAKFKLTPQQQEQIRSKKKNLKNAWVLPEWRYKQYKKQLAQDLGLSQAYF